MRNLRLAFVMLATFCSAPAFAQDDKLQTISDRLTAIEKQVTALAQNLERAAALDSQQSQLLRAVQEEVKSIHSASGLPRILGIKMPCANVGNVPNQQCAAFICTTSGYKNGGTAISYEPTSATMFFVTGVACRP
jgi:hypothetical protein